MIPFLLTALLMTPAVQEKTPERTPAKSAQKDAADPKAVQAAIAELDAALKDGKSAEIIQAIQKNTEVVDAGVIARITKALRDKDSGVKQAAIEALGRMKHPDSVKALTGYYQSEKRTLTTDEVLFPLVLKSLGRLGDPSSVAVLSDSPFSSKIFPSIQARLYGLGNIRTIESLEALIGFMSLGSERQFQALMGDWRVALVRLTGVDQGGESIPLWQKWWRENKKDFKIPAEPAVMTPELQMKWDAYWGTTPSKPPETRREPEKK